MRKLLLSLLLATTAATVATPALARPDREDRKDAREERQSKRSETKKERSDAREERSQTREERSQPRDARVEQRDARVQQRQEGAVNERVRPSLDQRQQGRADLRQERQQDRADLRQQRQQDRADLREQRQESRERYVERATQPRRVAPPAGARPDRPAPPPANVGNNRSPQWNTTHWRRDHRYDWRRHRDRNRSIFHLGIYFDPFGWGYHRWGIGWRLWPSYYSNSYWLNDPWMYRLPYAPWPYKWVRYYNDAVLVNVYTGQVVDVIYDFFW